MEIHGLSDQNIPFIGGPGSRGVSKVSWVSVQQTLNVFRAADQCASPTVQQSGLVQTTLSNCAYGLQVVLIAITGAGHQWPGGQPKSLAQQMMGADAPSTALNATDTLWDFFQSQVGR